MFFAPGLFPGKSVLAGVATRRAVVARGRAIIARVKIPGCSQEIRLAARRVTRPIGVSLLPDGDQKRVRADAADSAGLGVNPPNLKNWEKFQICCGALCRRPEWCAGTREQWPSLLSQDRVAAPAKAAITPVRPPMDPFAAAAARISSGEIILLFCRAKSNACERPLILRGTDGQVG